MLFFKDLCPRILSHPSLLTPTLLYVRLRGMGWMKIMSLSFGLKGLKEPLKTPLCQNGR